VNVAVAAGAAGGVGFRVTDAGAGLSPAELAAALRFFYTNVPFEEPTYGFSGNFGGQIEVCPPAHII
jgi:hypothetical protein